MLANDLSLGGYPTKGKGKNKEVDAPRRVEWGDMGDEH